jgi:hypothetical protein
MRKDQEFEAAAENFSVYMTAREKGSLFVSRPSRQEQDCKSRQQPAQPVHVLSL